MIGAEAVEPELGVERHAPGIRRAAGADPRRQGGEVEVIARRSHGVRHARRPERGGGRRGRVEQGRLDFVGSRQGVVRRDGQGDGGEPGGGGREVEHGGDRYRLGVEEVRVLDRVGQLEGRGHRCPPGVERRVHGRCGARGEVVGGGRGRDARPPPEAVGRGLGGGEVGGHRGEREGGDGVSTVVEGLAALEVEGAVLEGEAPPAEGEAVVQGRGSLEESGGRCRLHGVQWIGGVDGAAGTLDRLGGIVELAARAGALVVALDVGCPEGRQDLAGRTHRLDVAVAGHQQVAAGLLGHVVTDRVDDREGPRRGPRRGVEDQARRVLHEAGDQLEVRAAAHGEESGGIALLGVDRPQQGPGRGELVDGGAVVGGEVDVARGVHDRLGHLVTGAEDGRQRKAGDLGAGQRVRDQVGSRVDVEVRRRRREPGDATARGHQGGHGLRGQARRRRAEHRGRDGGGAHRADLGGRRGGHTAGDLRGRGRGVGRAEERGPGDDGGHQGRGGERPTSDTARQSCIGPCPVHNPQIGSTPGNLRRISLNQVI